MTDPATLTPPSDDVAVVPVPPAIALHTRGHRDEGDVIASWPGYSAIGPIMVPEGPPHPLTGAQAVEISTIIVCGACGVTFIVPLDRRMRAPMPVEKAQA